MLRWHRDPTDYGPDDASDIDALVGAGVLARESDELHPLFLVVAGEAVSTVRHHAVDTGGQLAALMAERWREFEARFDELELQGSSFVDAAFWLVGDLVLDRGVLDQLGADGRLLPPPPERPLDPQAGARYYLWLVGGSADDLGHYGSRTAPLDADGWAVSTFGRYWRDGHELVARDDRVDEIVTASRQLSPRRLADEFGVPLFDARQASTWAGVAGDAAAIVADHLHSISVSLRDLASDVRVDTGDRFHEFVCWYDHLA